MTARILLAEDDPKQAHVIMLYLDRNGYEVTAVQDGRGAVDVCRRRHPDLLLLDVMLPGLSGLEVCRLLRAESRVPIMLLTANNTEEDLVAGLDVGADDYITKPFSPRELVARVRTVLRRTGPAVARVRPLVRVGGLEVDPDRFEVRVDGRPVALTAKEFGILEMLATQPGRVFSRAEIVDRTAGFAHEVLARTVDAHVMHLRRKVEEDVTRPRYIQTVYGRGYRLVDPC